ncbi:hypothetical protein ACFPM0_22960 [Pseudonocardia sulfidoxydans]
MRGALSRLWTQRSLTAVFCGGRRCCDQQPADDDHEEVSRP